MTSLPLPNDLSINWSEPYGPIARGRSPTVSVNNLGQVVLIYATSIWSPRPELHAKVGQLNNGVVTWYDESKFDIGSFPSVGINDSGQVVSTHQENNGGQSLFYNTGTINDTTIDWNNSGSGTFYTTGISTTVDLDNDGLLVEVHRANVSESMWSLVGKLSGSGIDWKQDSTQFGVGQKPSVAINNHRAIAQFHESKQFYPGRIFDNPGIVDDGLQVRWFDSKETDGFLSAEPKVDINDSGVVVQVHASANGGMYYRVGTLSSDGRSIDEGASFKFLQAFEYDVTMTNDGQIIMVYAQDDTTKAENLFCVVGTLAT
ncbi:hypothetical protein C7S18_17450 [Ahniella affigens]|uniref:Uncharacterized protein n=1 Tax=Ahniella affigens TaxID=2021234 RepID=A0A2P1PVP8_9GAMM|nr:hypothetical protein [Ahniella affigens]AVP98854.1 hypothetical protein C7S18_17450 [Ahniella affigens]